MTPNIPPPDGRTDTIVFDLDGTLVDSLADLSAALNRLLQAERRPALVEAEMRTMVGDGVAKLVERGFTATGPVPGEPALTALVQRFEADYAPRCAELTRPYPGAEALVPALAACGWRLAVCTNKPQDATLRILEATGLLSHLRAVAGGDRYAYRKPDPRHLTQVIAEAGSVAARAILVGDGRQDLAAGQAAQVRTIAALYGYGGLTAETLGAAIPLPRFADLPGALHGAMRQAHGRHAPAAIDISGHDSY